MEFSAIMTSDLPVFRREVTVTLNEGLHLRPLAQISQFASGCECRIFLQHGKSRADARSSLELMALGAACGATLELEASGPGAEEALDKLAQMFASNFVTGHSG